MQIPGKWSLYPGPFQQPGSSASSSTGLSAASFLTVILEDADPSMKSFLSTLLTPGQGREGREPQVLSQLHRQDSSCNPQEHSPGWSGRLQEPAARGAQSTAEIKRSFC